MSEAGNEIILEQQGLKIYVCFSYSFQLRDIENEPKLVRNEKKNGWNNSEIFQTWWNFTNYFALDRILHRIELWLHHSRMSIS